MPWHPNVQGREILRKTDPIATTGPIPFGPVVILWTGGYLALTV